MWLSGSGWLCGCGWLCVYVVVWLWVWLCGCGGVCQKQAVPPPVGWVGTSYLPQSQRGQRPLQQQQQQQPGEPHSPASGQAGRLPHGLPCPLSAGRPPRTCLRASLRPPLAAPPGISKAGSGAPRGRGRSGRSSSLFSCLLAPPQSKGAGSRFAKRRRGGEGRGGRRAESRFPQAASSLHTPLARLPRPPARLPPSLATTPLPSPPSAASQPSLSLWLSVPLSRLDPHLRDPPNLKLLSFPLLAQILGGGFGARWMVG